MTLYDRRSDGHGLLKESLWRATSFAVAVTVISGFVLLANVASGDRAALTAQDLNDALTRLNGEIEALSTLIDNGDIEGMYSTAGTTVELLVARRDRLLLRLDQLAETQHRNPAGTAGRHPEPT